MGINKDQQSTIQNLVQEPVLWDAPLAPYTSINIGGPASAIVHVISEAELISLLKELKQLNVRYTVLGRGSNAIVSDAGFDGVVIILSGEFKRIQPAQEIGFTLSLEVGAGASLTSLCHITRDQGYAGAEFLLGIPGTIGGATVMNAGAWGDEIGNLVTAVTLVTEDGPHYLSRSEIPFMYRKWEDFDKNYPGAIVTEIHVLLHRATSEHVEKECQIILDKRKAAQGVTLPNAGSFFKNPEGTTAGELIDSCGLKGVKVGEAMVAEEHANFFVNCGGATAADIDGLKTLVQERVKKETGIDLEPEVRFI